MFAAPTSLLINWGFKLNFFGSKIGANHTTNIILFKHSKQNQKIKMFFVLFKKFLLYLTLKIESNE